jgi:hypothetical protein
MLLDLAVSPSKCVMICNVFTMPDLYQYLLCENMSNMINDYKKASMKLTTALAGIGSFYLGLAFETKLKGHKQ